VRLSFSTFEQKPVVVGGGSYTCSQQIIEKYINLPYFYGKKFESTLHVQNYLFSKYLNNVSYKW
jgi:hypothetical protein